MSIKIRNPFGRKHKSAVINLESENDDVEPHMLKILERDNLKRRADFEKDSSLAYEFVSSSLVLASAYLKKGMIEDARIAAEPGKTDIDKIQDPEKRESMEKLYSRINQKIGAVH